MGIKRQAKQLCPEDSVGYVFTIQGEWGGRGGGAVFFLFLRVSHHELLLWMQEESV